MNDITVNLENDVYYQESYANLYINNNDELLNFQYQEGDNIFKNVAIKRPITKIASQKITENYFDLETPYGYGGYYTNSDESKFVQRAIKKYQAYCLERNIISEFIRFNPFNNFPVSYPDYFNLLIQDRKTIYIALNDSYDNIRMQYKSSLRRNIRKADSNNLVFFEISNKGDAVAPFAKLYEQTMHKNKAAEMYYFGSDYIQKLFNLPYIKVYGINYNNTLVTIVCVLEAQEIVYYHLGATDPYLYHLNSNPYLFDQLVKKYMGKKKFIYMGGGTTNLEDDSLYRFKSKFSPYYKYFYISGKIFNQQKYDEYVQIWQADHSDKPQPNYFLKYRL